MINTLVKIYKKENEVETTYQTKCPKESKEPEVCENSEPEPPAENTYIPTESPRYAGYPTMYPPAIENSQNYTESSQNMIRYE